MKTPSIIVCVLGCSLALGCRWNPKIAMLEQECRMHEDRVYAMEDRLQMAQSELCDLKRENAELRTRWGQDGGSFTGSSQSSSSRSSAGSSAPPEVNVELPNSGTKELSPEDFEKASTSPPSPGVIDPDALPPLETPSAPSFRPEGASPSGDRDESVPHGRPGDGKTRIREGKVLYREEGPRLRGDSREVEKITISDMMTGGVNADGRKGDEGIFVVVEPRDADGRLVPAVGPISLIAMDPALPKEKSQVARWDFTEKELPAQFRRSGSAEGFHLEVRWPEVSPRHEHLKLFIRYITADARKLYAQAPIRVALTPKTNTIVARPEPRPTDTVRSDGWSSRPGSHASEAVSSPRVASVPAHPINQSIPPVREDPICTRRPQPRPRPVWSPERL